MDTTTASRRQISTDAEGSEQLTLLPNTAVTPRFRLSKDTRERGLRHVAEIRQMIADRTVQHPSKIRHDRAA